MRGWRYPRRVCRRRDRLHAMSQEGSGQRWHKLLRFLELLHLGDWLRHGGLLHALGAAVSGWLAVWEFSRGSYILAILMALLLAAFVVGLTLAFVKAKRAF